MMQPNTAWPRQVPPCPLTATRCQTQVLTMSVWRSGTCPAARSWLDGGAAVRAMAEAITLVRALSGGGDPVPFDGEFYHVDGLDPAAAPTPKVFTGSVGPKSL